MLTTAGLMRSTMSAKLTAVAKRVSGRAADPLAGFTSGPATTADRARPPAKMVPTRNATAAVKISVTNVKRRDI
jgi:hypothetical protein